MVSIPDWARFAQLINTKQQDSQNLLNKFYKQKETEVMKHALESGYIFVATKVALSSHCIDQNPEENDVTKFRLISLAGIHIRNLGDIWCCSNLTICLLSNNYLTKIDSLAHCKHLIKLDLHSNQLITVPGLNFWSHLRNLQILHLHDNPLGKFEILKNLSSCSYLTLLTLYDTPLALKKNYRHHVVNSIWTLKALDHFVISDEEIIEDAVFNGRFQALSPPFKIILCPPTNANPTYSTELEVIKGIMMKVNRILAKHSPVLIVQRCIRGFLVRKRLRRLHALGGLKLKEVFPPPGTPIYLKDQVKTSLLGVNIDYDTYMKNRRPGSLVPEETFRSMQSEEMPSMVSNKSLIVINMDKLQEDMLSSLQADTVAMEKLLADKQKIGLPHNSPKESSIKKAKKSDTKSKFSRIKNQKQFFGPVVFNDSLDDSEDEESIPFNSFRLKGQTEKFIIADATTEMILNKKESGKMVREAETERMTKAFFETKPKIERPNFLTNEQRLFNRAQGTMGLSCLMAVQKAYNEREKAEKAAAKIENILGLREERLRSQDRVNMYREQRRLQVLKARDLERSLIMEQIEKHELEKINFLDKQQERKVRSSDVNKQSRSNQTFVVDFNSQHTSVSKALLRHDRQARWEDSHSNRRNQVTNAKLTELEQQDVVKNYMEHRQLMRQTETSVAKAALGTKMLAEANERMMDARNRVAQLKARQSSIQAYYPVRQSTIPLSS
ncbi:leucine-rich repeat and IQ domain-containing protein 3 [Biomphalaria pfeifferi]|uniref:Leucine-rich repeat and IQ domain-containing protein 3 n=1 Tax=Biomphalaria pfeifferi TaxID=112525 RepID=A0AAD8BZ89_BIOPF|nr:leucine-rich repeat and IQ domain-containing protein 3 [Biomphalaria pfeifferi]